MHPSDAPRRRWPHRRDSLQFRVTAALALFVAVVVSLMILALFAINQRLEADLLNGIVSHEMHEMATEYPEQGEDAIPSSATITGFIVAPGQLDTLPKALRSLPRHDPGINITFDHRRYRVGTAMIDGKRAFIAYDITAFETREQLFGMVLLVAALIVLALAVPLGMWIARISLKPINALAEQVGHLQPGDRAPALAIRFERYEVGVIARAFDRFMDRLDEYVERERSFTADASHELRTPLAVIQGALEILQQDARLATSAPLTRIDRAARQMGELIEALLFLAREEPNGNAGAVPSCRADHVIRELIEAYRPLMARNDVDVATIESCTVHAPRIALVIVFGNLLRNALQHGGGQVTVSLTGGQLAVADNGHGMNSEQLKQAFDRGFRAGPGAGLGLGLYLVKRIADRYGWQITLASQPGQGTRIALQLASC